MSSNVLKNLNDCYNFKDDNNSDHKTKAKQRQRLRTYSLTSKSAKCQSHTTKSSDVPKENQKRDTKWRCDVFKEILSSAVWLNDIRADSRSSIDTVLNLLDKHMRAECKCSNLCYTHLLNGNTYFERFLFIQKEFENKVISEENKDLESKKGDDSKSSTINDIPNQKDSKIESTVFPYLVNLHNMSALLLPLEQAVYHWKRAFELDNEIRSLTEDAIIGFKIYYNLSSVVQIYTLYNQMESRFRAAQLLNDYCNNYSSKVSDISLTANYYLVKTYLDLGAVMKASLYLTRISSSINSRENPKMPETFGKSLNLLAKCEIDFFNGKVERAAKNLKLFLSTGYLQKLTINRYYIKGLSLLLATKFMSKHFEFAKNFQEFIEPIQMSLSILKRWNPWLSTTNKPNENQIINCGDLDPIWYRFAVMNFTFDAMQMSAHFFVNIEMPVDSVFYFNALIKLGRRYCLPVRLSKLLVIGSHLDVLCDHKSSAQTKLLNASFCLQSKSYSSDSESVFDSHSSVSTISPDTRKAIGDQPRRGLTQRINSMKSDSELEIIEVDSQMNQSFNSDECEHNKEISLWDLKKKFRRNQNSSDSDDSLQEIGRNMTKISFNQNDCTNGVIELFLIKLEIDLNTLVVNETDSKYILSQIVDIIKNSFESYASSAYRQQISEFLNEYRLDEMHTSCDYYKTLKFKIIENIARIQVQLKQYGDAIKTCNEISGAIPSTYEQRVYQSYLLYFEAFSKLQLYKTKHNINSDSVWIEYSSLLDSDSTVSQSKEQSVTPTRSQNKVITLTPKAPKHKPYINDEIQDYMNALSKCVYEESKAGTSVASNVNPFRLKHNMKLNFENDAEFRSLSVSDSTLESSERSVSGDLISTEVSSKRKITTKTVQKTIQRTQRMTRSRSSTMKTNTKCPEVVNLVTDSELDDLDEVFDDLCITRNLFVPKTKEISLESIANILKKIIDLISSHPSSKLYILVHKLLTEIYSISDELNEELIGYHFAESVRSTYRYRNLFIEEKKRKLKRVSKYQLNTVEFSADNIEANNTSKIFTNSLPTDWRIVQIIAVDNGSKIPELMVCRYQSGKKPVYLKIKSDPQKIIKHFMTHFVEIIERSNASIVNKDRETFWRLRYSLDEELMVLLRSVEDTWFGPFKGILFGQLQSQSYNKMCKQLNQYLLDKANINGLSCVSEPLLKVLVESLPCLKRSEFATAMKLLFTAPSQDLIAKCYDKYEEMFCDVFPIDEKQSIFTKYQISPVGLILDKSLDGFPFECLPTIHGFNQSIFRTPSLRILSLMYNTFKDDVYSKGVNESEVYYVLNPSDNLAKTEDYFKNSFISMDKWKGVIGKAPNPSELRNALDSKEAYIFFGHGAGACYYRAMPDGLDGSTVNSASVVIGCSSGKLFSDGKQLESYGTPYRFLMNGCPSYVGVLWDVTDKDIDKFSDHFLSYWFSEWKPELRDKNKIMLNTKAVSMSRQFCRLKYLIGAAPVVYGLPLFSTT